MGFDFEFAKNNDFRIYKIEYLLEICTYKVEFIIQKHVES